MGLDNGIDFKILDKEKFGEIPAWIKREEWEEKYGFDYEMLYWRKCWNVRQEILIYLGSSDDEYEWVLDLNDLNCNYDINNEKCRSCARKSFRGRTGNKK